MSFQYYREARFSFILLLLWKELTLKHEQKVGEQIYIGTQRTGIDVTAQVK